MEVATALAYGGAGQWIMDGLQMSRSGPVKQWPKNVQLLVQDHQKQPFSSPSLVINSAEAVRSPFCTFMSPECSEDYYATFALVALGEIARYSTFVPSLLREWRAYRTSWDCRIPSRSISGGERRCSQVVGASSKSRI